MAEEAVGGLLDPDRGFGSWVWRTEQECWAGPPQALTCALGCREPHCDLEAPGVLGAGPVQALPSTCVQKVEEQPGDADNQRNVTRMGSQPPDPGAPAHTPVTPAGPPGETTLAPSEYLPKPTLCFPYPSRPWQPPGDRARLCVLSPPRWREHHIRSAPLPRCPLALFPAPGAALSVLLSKNICEFPAKCQAPGQSAGDSAGGRGTRAVLWGLQSQEDG